MLGLRRADQEVAGRTTVSKASSQGRLYPLGQKKHGPEASTVDLRSLSQPFGDQFSLPKERQINLPCLSPGVLCIQKVLPILIEDSLCDSLLALGCNYESNMVPTTIEPRAL